MKLALTHALVCLALSPACLWANEIAGPRSAPTDHSAPRMLRASLLADFRHPERSRMRVLMSTSATEEATRDQLRQQLYDLVEAFSANPDPAQIPALLEQLKNILGQFNENETPGDAEDLLENLVELWKSLDGQPGEDDLDELLGEIDDLSDDLRPEVNDPDDPVDEDKLAAKVNDLTGRISALMARFGEEFPELVNTLMARIQEALDGFNAQFPQEVTNLVENINQVLADFNGGETPDFSSGVPENFQEILDNYIDSQLQGKLDGLQEQITALIDQFHEETLPGLLDGLLSSVQGAIATFVQTELPALLDQLLADLQGILTEWEISEAFSLQDREDADSQVLTVKINGTEFSGTFDEDGVIEGEILAARFSGDAGSLKVDLTGAALLEALGIDPSQSGKNLALEVPIEITLSGGTAKNGYRAELPTPFSILLDKNLDFSLRQTAHSKATGRH